MTRVAGKLINIAEAAWLSIFQVFSDPTAENGFGRALVSCQSCPPAAGSGQPPSFGYVLVFQGTRETVADGILAQSGPRPETE